MPLYIPHKISQYSTCASHKLRYNASSLKDVVDVWWINFLKIVDCQEKCNICYFLVYNLYVIQLYIYIIPLSISLITPRNPGTVSWCVFYKVPTFWRYQKCQEKPVFFGRWMRQDQPFYKLAHFCGAIKYYEILWNV